MLLAGLFYEDMMILVCSSLLFLYIFRFALFSDLSLRLPPISQHRLCHCEIVQSFLSQQESLLLVLGLCQEYWSGFLFVALPALQSLCLVWLFVFPDGLLVQAISPMKAKMHLFP